MRAVRGLVKRVGTLGTGSLVSCSLMLPVSRLRSYIVSIRLNSTDLCVVLIVQPNTADVITGFPVDRGQQLQREWHRQLWRCSTSERVSHIFDREDCFSDLAVEDAPYNQKCLRLTAIESIHAHITACVNQLSEMRLPILGRYEANKMSPGRHGGVKNG